MQSRNRSRFTLISLAGAIAGIAASGIAAAFYALDCADDSPLFVCTWYPLATLAIEPEILDERWELTHPDLALEEESG